MLSVSLEDSNTQTGEAGIEITTLCLIHGLTVQPGSALVPDCSEELKFLCLCRDVLQQLENLTVETGF